MSKVCKHLRIWTLMIALVPSITLAQNVEDISIFLNAGEDASKLLSAYLDPTVRSLSYGMTGNWYTTAATHKSLGIDFSISGNVAFIPTSANYFDPAKLNMSVTTFNGNIDNPGKGAPTFFGPKDRTSYTSTYDHDDDAGTPDQTLTFDGPEGLNVKKEFGFSGIPVPVVQLGIGIIKNTDLKIRFIPKIGIGKKADIQMFGIGVQHDIKQHIKGIKLLPFDLSVLAAYNSLKGSADLRHEYGGAGDYRPASDDGTGEYKFDSWLFMALISKKISVLTFYGGLGYSFIDTKVDVNGTYTIQGTIPFDIKDPVSMQIENKSFRFTGGMRLKFGPIFLNGDYTFQKYNLLTVGLGFSVR